MKFLLVLGFIIMSLPLFSQKKGKTPEKDLGIHIFVYKLDSVWIANGDPKIAMVELWKEGKVTSHKSRTANIQLHFSQDSEFKDKIVFLDPLLKIHDTLYVEVLSHLNGDTFISLAMNGYLKPEYDETQPDYKVTYIINHTPRLIVFRTDMPERRAMYFIQPIDNIIIPKN